MDFQGLFLLLVLGGAIVLATLLIAWLVDRKKPAPTIPEREPNEKGAQPTINTEARTESEPTRLPEDTEKEQAIAPAPTAVEIDADDLEDLPESEEEISSPVGIPILTVDDMRLALEEAGKTQTELAEAIGVSRFYISKILAGKKPFTMELQSRVKSVLTSWSVDVPEPLADEASPQVNSGP